MIVIAPSSSGTFTQISTKDSEHRLPGYDAESMIPPNVGEMETEDRFTPERFISTGIDDSSPRIAASGASPDESVEEAKESVDAEEWLTRKIPSGSCESDDEQLDNKENEMASPTNPKDEGLSPDQDQGSDVEHWLTRGNRELLMQWKSHEESMDINEQCSDRYRAIETLSTASSAGSSFLREKLERRMSRRQGQIERAKLEQTPEDHPRFGDSMDDIMDAWSEGTPPTSPTSDSGLTSDVDAHARKQIRNTHSTDSSSSLYRLCRTIRYGRRGEMPPGHTNVVRLHVYDLLANNTIMPVLGCDFPIGKCFQAMNNGLHALGTGAYHCGIEVNGIEYGYGANDLAGSTGVFTCVPKRSPGYEYRATIDFGARVARRKSWINIQTDLVNTKTGKETKVSDTYEEVENYVDGKTILKQMALEYRGTDYDLLKKNCCTFAQDACIRLGVSKKEIPTWFMNLATMGADARDAAQCLVFPGPKRTLIAKAQETNEDDEFGGYECILAEKLEGVTVVDTVTQEEAAAHHPETPGNSIGVRRTLSWTY